MGPVFSVTMYRWGSREYHSYILGVYSSFMLAEVMADDEKSNRGGKYGYEIMRHTIDGDSKSVKKMGSPYYGPEM